MAGANTTEKTINVKEKELSSTASSELTRRPLRVAHEGVNGKQGGSGGCSPRAGKQWWVFP